METEVSSILNVTKRDCAPCYVVTKMGTDFELSVVR